MCDLRHLFVTIEYEALRSSGIYKVAFGPVAVKRALSVDRNPCLSVLPGALVDSVPSKNKTGGYFLLRRKCSYTE